MPKNQFPNVDQCKQHPDKNETGEGTPMSRQDFTELVDRAVASADPDEPLLLLESQLEGHPSSRCSILATGARTTLEARGERITLQEEGGARECFRQNPWEALEQVRRSRPGWYLGYLGYDLKNGLEKLESRNPDPVGAPDLCFFRPRTLLIYDHRAGRLLGPPPDVSGGTSKGSRMPDEPFRLESLDSLTPRAEYLRRVERARELIREGEVYEVNLSHLLHGRYRGESFDLYRRMRSGGGVPFGAYLRWKRWSVCSASPERFLRREGSRLYSQPIKGTAPRLPDPDADAQMQRALVHSEKDRAENLMIVDLVRHDLSRVTRPGSIRVPKLFSLESFETVHQLISTVEGEVDETTDPVAMLKACFPMGSMTGAPKIRAMKVIEELEDYKRGIYSGAIGYIRPDGDFDFNVVIRTAILNGNMLAYPVGGAITSDSDAESELEETRVKARALTRALHTVENPLILPD